MMRPIDIHARVDALFSECQGEPLGTCIARANEVLPEVTPTLVLFAFLAVLEDDSFLVTEDDLKTILATIHASYLRLDRRMIPANTKRLVQFLRSLGVEEIRRGVWS